LASGRKRKPTLRELAALEPTAAESAKVEAWLDAAPGSALRPADLARLLDIWNDENAPYPDVRAAGKILARYDLALVVDVYAPGKPKPTNAKPAKSKRQHGHRFTDDEVYDAVARALADGVTGLGRLAEAHRPASGYELWRMGQHDGDKLPGGRAIRLRFKPRQTKRDRDTWATVVRLGRKAGRIA
jgi:hypothetical protein